MSERSTYASMLRETLDFAVERIPWYRERADQYHGPIENVEDLARLPLVRKADLANDPRAFSSSSEHPVSVTFSSATTGVIGQPRWHSAAELEARNMLANRLQRGREEPDGATLVIHPYDQGPALPGPESGRIFAGLLVPWHFDYVHSILRDGWTGPSGVARIARLEAFSPGLRVLTCWLEQRGIDPTAFGVQQLVGYGSIQPPVWRRRLRQTWATGYVDVYGLSEVPMSNAILCPLCEAYHFFLPVIPEVVGPSTMQPIAEGTGILVLTELYPYSQLQLLVRYVTDDLVEIAEPCVASRFGIRVRGRRSESALVERTGRPSLVVGAVQVAEVASELPDVAFAEISWARWALDAGAPRVRVDAEGRVVRITLELRYAPGLHPSRADEVAEAAGSSLRAAVTGLAEAVDAGEAELVVETVGPGELSEPAKV